MQRVAREIEQLGVDPVVARDPPLSDADFRRAVLAGYPDRVAQRRERDLPRVRLASGAGAASRRESGVTEGEFLVAIDVQTSSTTSPEAKGPRTKTSRITIRLASLVDRDWLEPNDSELVHWFDLASGMVKATMGERYDALVLADGTTPDPAMAARAADRRVDRARTRPRPTTVVRRLVSRVDPPVPAARARAAAGARFA